jgi:2-phospho-L-lactate guanylyltransferase
VTEPVSDVSVHWTIVVPLKALPAAKSRLVSASPDPASHAQLVDAIRADTLAVAASAGRLLVIFDQAPVDEVSSIALPEPVLVQTGDGLNQALREAADYVHAHWPGDAVAALVGDLAALRPGDLEATLAEAASHARGFVADLAGTGTTLLTAAPGLGSAARHAQLAQPLSAAIGLRLDIDTAADLDQARELGVGPATQAILATKALSR